jgi:hypothetical protein
MSIFIHTKIKLMEKGTGIPLFEDTVSVKLKKGEPSFTEGKVIDLGTYLV